MKVTLNKDGTPRKSGSGRRKGANSFVSIRVSDLEQFCGQNTLIPVSRVWLEQMGANIQAKPTNITAQEKVLDEPEQKIAFKLHQ